MWNVFKRLSRSQLMSGASQLIGAGLSRRQLVGGAVAASAVGVGIAAAAQTTAPPVDFGNPDNPDVPEAATGTDYRFFKPAEVVIMAKLLDRIIPEDELGPGAHETGVTFFIDRQLAGSFGKAARSYKQGPWADGKPTQGYQARLTPADIYRTAIAAIEKYSHQKYGKGVADLTTAQQDEIVTALEKHEIDLDGASRGEFFNLLLQNANEGYFSDPVYGGNRNMAGWRLVGFPGAHYDYRPYVSLRNKKLTLEPVGIMGGPRWTVKS